MTKAVVTSSLAGILASNNLTGFPKLSRGFAWFIISGVVVVETLVRVIEWREERGVQKLSDNSAALDSCMIQLHQQVRVATGIDPKHYRVGLYICRRSLRRPAGNQVRVKTLSVGPASKGKRRIIWTKHTGVIGSCWRQLETQDVDLSKTSGDRHGLSVEELEATRNWTRIIASPLVDQDRYLGCVVIDFIGTSTRKKDVDWNSVRHSADSAASICVGLTR